MRSNSRRSATYRAFREVGRVIRTVQLLRYLSDPALRQRVTAATNKVESYNNFCQWLGFGNGGVIADNDPDEQEKTIKFNSLLANCVIFHTTLDLTKIAPLPPHATAPAPYPTYRLSVAGVVPTAVVVDDDHVGLLRLAVLRVGAGDGH